MRFESTASRVCSSGACHSISSSKVRLASSIIAQSSPVASTSTRRSSLPSSGRPSESGEPPGGSIVSTATFLPRAAMPRAIAADVVVLPTPPEPAQMQISFRSSQPAITAALQADRTAARSRGGASAGSNRYGSVATGVSRPRAQAPSCNAGPGRAGTRALRRGRPGRRRYAAVESRKRLTSSLVKRSGQHDRWPQPRRGPGRCRRQPRLELDRLVDRHLLRQCDPQHPGPRPVAQEPVDLARLAGDRPYPRDVRVGARCRSSASPCPVGGGVHDHRVEAGRPCGPRLREVPYLADRHQFGHARAPPR